jgi:DNA-binding response OmpR family regulator
MNLRLDESSGALPRVPVLMLLDRTADIFLAKRSGADAWLVKPLDALSIQRAVHGVLHPSQPDAATDATTDGDDDVETDADSAEEEAVPAG